MIQSKMWRSKGEVIRAESSLLVDILWDASFPDTQYAVTLGACDGGDQGPGALLVSGIFEKRVEGVKVLFQNRSINNRSNFGVDLIAIRS